MHERDHVKFSTLQSWKKDNLKTYLFTIKKYFKKRQRQCRYHQNTFFFKFSLDIVESLETILKKSPYYFLDNFNILKKSLDTRGVYIPIQSNFIPPPPSNFVPQLLLVLAPLYITRRYAPAV